MNMVAKAGNPIAPDQMIENRTFDEIAVGDRASSVRTRGLEAIELYVFRIAREAAALAGSRGGLDGSGCQCRPRRPHQQHRQPRRRPGHPDRRGSHDRAPHPGNIGTDRISGPGASTLKRA